MPGRAAFAFIVRTSAAALLAQAGAARASPTPPAAIQPAPGARTGTLSAEYDGYSHGLIVIRMTASLTLTPTSYAGRLAYHTAGLVAWVVHNTSDSQVTGRFDGERLVPIRFDSTGDLRHVDRVTRMAYRDGKPTIEVLTPPVEQERAPVPPAQTANTIDTLSAIVMLVRQVGVHGTCDGSVMTFDGRRLTALTARTVGQEVLPASGKTRYAGEALRCDFDGNQLAGFVKSEDEDQLRRTRHGAAWLQQVVPGAPLVPVRINFENKILGQVTLYLQSVTGAPGVSAQIASKPGG